MAQSMKSKEGELRHLSQRMDALEREVSLLITMASWLVKKHDGDFQIAGDKGASSSARPPHPILRPSLRRRPRFLLLMMNNSVLHLLCFAIWVC